MIETRSCDFIKQMNRVKKTKNNFFMQMGLFDSVGILFDKTIPTGI